VAERIVEGLLGDLEELFLYLSGQIPDVALRKQARLDVGPLLHSLQTLS
jgi:hypothetical protein